MESAVFVEFYELCILTQFFHKKCFKLVFQAYFCYLCEEPITKLCGVLISFYEVKKLKSFEFGVSDIIPANVQNISPLVFFIHLLLILRGRKFPQSFMVFWTIFHELMKLRNFEWLKYIDVSDVIHAIEHTYYANCMFNMFSMHRMLNMLIVAYI